MGNTLGKAIVEIGGDLTALKKAFDKAKKETDKSTKNITQKLVAAGKKMQAAGKTLTLGVTLPLIAAGTAATKMAMDVEESENLFTVSMGKMEDSARKWSKDLRKNLGLNEFEVRKNVSTFNVMLNSMGLSETAAYDMSKGLTQLSYDMASFYNLKPEEAFLKLQSGISGEAEPLKRLGILVNENTIKAAAYEHGIAKVGEQLTETQKVEARYIAIMEQTSKAQGDLARTADSPTNRLRILKDELKQTSTEFGQVLIPVLIQALEKLKKLSEWLSNLSEEQKKTIVKFAAIAAAIGPVLLGIGKLLILAPKLVGAFSKVKVALELMVANPIIVGIALVGAAIAALVIESAKLKKAIAEGTLENVKFNNEVMRRAISNITETQTAKIEALKTEQKEEQSAFEQKIALIEEEKKASIEAKKEELEEKKSLLKDAHEATIEAIREEYGYIKETNESKTDLTNKYYDNQIRKANEAYNEKVMLINKELGLQLQQLDANAQKQVKAIQDQIAQIDEKTAAEEKALKDAATAKRIAELEDEVAKAKTAEEEKTATERLNEYLNKIAREKLLEKRTAEKEALTDKIKDINENTKSEKEALEEAAAEKIRIVTETKDEEIRIIEEKRKWSIAAIQEEREKAEEAATAAYEAKKKSLEDQQTEMENGTSNYYAELDKQVAAKITAENDKLAATKERIDNEIKELQRLSQEAVAASGIAAAAANKQAMAKYEELNRELQKALDNPFSWETISRGGVAGYTRRLENEGDRLKGIGVPGFATGGMINTPQLAVVGEEEREAIIPMSRFNEVLQAAREAGATNGGGVSEIKHSGEITVNGINNSGELIDIIKITIGDVLRTESRVYGN